MELKLEHLAIAMVNNMLLQYFDDERELLHNDCKIVSLRAFRGVFIRKYVLTITHPNKPHSKQ